MDKEFLKKYKLQEAVKRFQQINEYTFITSPMLAEDGDEDNNQQPQQDVNVMGGNTPPMPNDGNMNGGNNAQMPPEQTGGDMQNMQNGNPDDNAMMPPPPPPQMDNGEQMGGDLPNNSENEDSVGEEDTIIDVDDLTDSQEATEYKIDGVDDKLTRMLSVLSKFSAALEASDKKIDDLRQEFERRNPSEQEKLNIRSQASYPYSETPKDYWDNKTATNPHYNVMYDNDVSTADEQEKFDITKDDIKNINFKNIADSFDIDNMKLDDFMKF